jgi:uncharacterized membrane protein YdbT with pleckstrin-like domain
MAALDELIPGEEVVHTTEKHWIAPLRTSLVALAMIVGAILIGVVSPDADDGLLGLVANLLDLARTALFVSGIGWIVYNIIVWRTATFAITSRRVIREEGIISRRSSATILGSITDVQTRVSAAGKAMGYGDLVIVGQSGEAAADRFVAIVDPRLFRDRMLAAKIDAEEGRKPASGTATNVVAPVAAAPEDPVATLARLAELRDRGAVTSDEFDAKKAEILARI